MFRRKEKEKDFVETESEVEVGDVFSLDDFSPKLLRIMDLDFNLTILNEFISRTISSMLGVEVAFGRAVIYEKFREKAQKFLSEIQEDLNRIELTVNELKYIERIKLKKEKED